MIHEYRVEMYGMVCEEVTERTVQVVNVTR